MMNKDAIRQLYDQQQRIGAEYPRHRRIVTPRTVRYVDDQFGYGGVVYSDLDAANADQTIREEIAYFTNIGITDRFEWKLYDYDTPADLADRLTAHGFVPDDVEALLVLDLNQIPPALAQPITHDVRRITDPADLEDMRAVNRAVWIDEDTDWMVDALAHTLREAPDTMSVYIAYADGVPASAARIDFSEHSEFAGLWGGSIVPEYRQRGLYTALVSVRAQEAIRRGKRYLTIDASPMSRAVLEKHGFELLAYTTPYNYRGAETTS